MDTELPCQACEKRKATVHLTDIAPDGQKQERHLCEHCAQSEGVTPSQTAYVPINELLSGLLGHKQSVQELADLSCPDCGLTFAEFRNNGLLGCSKDYDVFARALIPLIERAHEGQSHHVGKSPRRHGDQRPEEGELIRLRRELTRAVDSEDYEAAARIRDVIRIKETP